MNKTRKSSSSLWHVALPGLLFMAAIGAFWWALHSLNITSEAAIAIAVGIILAIFSIAWQYGQQRSLSKRVHKEVEERTNELEQASLRFRMITDNAYDLISILSLNGDLVYTNSAYHRVLGYSREDLLKRSFVTMVHPKDAEALETTLRDVAETGRTAEITFRMRHKSGDWKYLEAVAKGLHDKEWALTNIVIHCRDVSSRKKYADELARSEQRFRDFADSSADWLWEVNDEFEFTYVSPGVKQTLGFEVSEMVGRLKFDSLFDQAADMTRDLIESRVERQQAYRDIEFWTHSKAEERICLRISGVPIFDEKQNFKGYRGVATNITTSKLDRDNMFRLATTDHLTGLLNRARFSEELERTLTLARRHKTQGVLLFVDLDQFKGVNDTHGHDAGDELIRAVANVLKESVRGTDIIARLGGDEFGIIMHNIDVARAKVKVQKIIDELSAIRVPYNGVTLHCTMSIGMICYPQEDRDSNSLLMSADLAMYRAKDMGRNRLYVDGEDASTENGDDSDVNVRKNSLREQLKWVDRLRTALDEGDFEMYYQPLVPSESSDVPHFEALIRLRDEDGKVGAPGVFIDAAEHFGLIQKLDMAVLERCISQQLEMKAKGIHAKMSINLSGKSLGDPNVIEELKSLIDKYKGMDPSDFTFEVTETAALHDPKEMKDMEKIQSFIASLKALGFKFSLDDFGTGFSSFNYIKHLDVDIVKIDGSFILPLEHSTKDRLFVKAIVDLAKGLGIKTVAEFVENERILKVLRELGVDYAQGYHLSKPKPDLKDLCGTFHGQSMDDYLPKV